MRKNLVVWALVVLAISIGGLVGSGNNVSDQALDNAAYQSALVERTDLPGVRIPLPWAPPPSEGWYIGRDQPTWWGLGWMDPTGRDAEELGNDPGRSTYPDKGAGPVTFRLWVDGIEVNLSRTGGVEYFPAYETWGVIKWWWITFPAYYFEAGQHTFYFEIDVANLPEYYMEESVVVNFD